MTESTSTPLSTESKESPVDSTLEVKTQSDHPDHPTDTDQSATIAKQDQAATHHTATHTSTQAPANTSSSEASTMAICLSKIESISQSVLGEQKRKHRWNLFFRLSWLCLVAAFIWLSFSAEQGSSPSSGPHTAVVQIKGEISDGVDASALHVVEALKAALEDPSTKAVVLLINSPGGSPVQAGIINDEIYRLKAIYKKPVYAVVEETCASAAYYIASAADQIYVDKASIVGSIGVLMDGFGFTGLMGKLGVERRLLTAGSNKGMLDPFSPQNPDQKVLAQQMLEQIHQQFIAVVRKGRGSRLKETPETFSGLFWTGEQAVQMGLADHLGNIDYVAREVVKAKDIIDYTRKENVAERLAKRFGASIGEGMVKAMNAKSIEIK
jgi:protease-4